MHDGVPDPPRPEFDVSTGRPARARSRALRQIALPPHRARATAGLGAFLDCDTHHGRAAGGRGLGGASAGYLLGRGCDGHAGDDSCGLPCRSAVGSWQPMWRFRSRIILAASPQCGLLNKATLDHRLLCPCRYPKCMELPPTLWQLRNRDTRSISRAMQDQPPLSHPAAPPAGRPMAMTASSSSSAPSDEEGWRELSLRLRLPITSTTTAAAFVQGA